jgi:hypothetical protein
MQETSVGWSATGVTPIHELRQGPTLTEYPRAKSPGRELRAEKEAHRAREGDEAATPADHVRDADAPLGVFAPQPRTR